jgi:hypothetical protein
MFDLNGICRAHHSIALASTFPKVGAMPLSDERVLEPRRAT